MLMLASLMVSVRDKENNGNVTLKPAMHAATKEARMDGRKKKVSTWAPEWLSRRLEPDSARVSILQTPGPGRDRG